MHDDSPLSRTFKKIQFVRQMSFGGPSQSKNRIAPPERGSFPLDHEGDCKTLVKDYLKCIKENRGQNAPCRSLAKTFLKCRMDHGLMGQDEFKNLGFSEAEINQ